MSLYVTSDLMSGSILSQPNRVVGSNPDDLSVVQGCQPQSPPRIVREDKESSSEWDESAVVARNPVAVSRGDRCQLLISLYIHSLHSIKKR